MEHQKHAFLQKPAGGKFHRHEFAFLGAPCGIIQRLADDLASELIEFNLGYVDADHGEGEDAPPFGTAYTDKISHHRFEMAYQDYTYKFRQLFGDNDAVLVNGNHFKAEYQIVIINKKKEESLQRKLDRLTHVKAFVLDQDMHAVFPFLREAIPNADDIPVFGIDEVEKIASLLRLEVKQRPSIRGLVFAGGRSTRMGRDKGAIVYHGKPQREYLADLLNDICEETFISTQNTNDFTSAYPLLADSFREMGPYGGLLTAFRMDPNSAWLTVACDIPLIDKRTLNRLIEERDPGKIATCFHNEETNFPEPLITLWEPRAYPQLLQFMALGYSCPRKVLINSDIHELTIDQVLLTNANTPEELARAQSLIHA